MRKLATAPRSVVGYHGCTLRSAERILADGRFIASARAYDWLGEGVYFWEYAPYRALEWAIARATADEESPAVLRATIQLGRCLNLLDTPHMQELEDVYDSLISKRDPSARPRNTSGGAHYLDREVIDGYCRMVPAETRRDVQSVHGSLAEGGSIFPGSKILRKAHVQIAVRDPACIRRVTLVLFE